MSFDYKVMSTYFHKWKLVKTVGSENVMPSEIRLDVFANPQPILSQNRNHKSETHEKRRQFRDLFYTVEFVMLRFSSSSNTRWVSLCPQAIGFPSSIFHISDHAQGFPNDKTVQVEPAIDQKRNDRHSKQPRQELK
jgi:hypothetical protein